MTKRMLIDANHPEETRVVVLDGTRLEEFDVESSTKKQLKGNIYLAKVVRVEPSLQAAFVDYGGNRHGFLAFNEIHPDYYQIPVADREALLAQYQGEDEDLDDDDEDEDDADTLAAEDASADGEEDETDDGNDADGDSLETPDKADAGQADPVEAEADQSGADQPEAEQTQGVDGALEADSAESAIASEAADEASPEDQPDQAETPDGGDDATAEGESEDPTDPPSGTIALAAQPVESVTGEVDEETAAEAENSVASEPLEDAAEATSDAEKADLSEAGDPAEAEDSDDSDDGDDGSEDPDEMRADDDSDNDNDADEESDDGDDDSDDDDDGDADGDGDADVSAAGRSRRPRRTRPIRHYKIQEVIKRRQILLVQVVKEERGNKGAALTTYLSLAGRYCVFMPNTTRGGGVSRKITSANDRKRLKSIMSDLHAPKGSAVILRTAGAERSKAEVKRDFEYLLRTWDTIRNLTLESRAPAPIHEEASLIKRAIRDIYSRDIEEVQVEGDAGYRMAKDFMKLLTPSHAKKVQPYREESMPLFHRYQVESQLDAMHSPTAQLRSGGYIVINQTEALVAIDVNSGRSTRERNIEDTAYKTNLEAADEIARQLRLRDLSGLIVIDFIDMEDNRSNTAVERRLKDALKSDRARIQVGRISHFGLLELSRQRLRPSIMETSFLTCPHCQGTGVVRSLESAAVHTLRIIEEEGVRRRSSEITLYLPTEVALYILNQKRDVLAGIEDRYCFKVYLQGDASLVVPDYRMERIKQDRRDEKDGEDDRTERSDRALPAPPRARDLPPEDSDEDAEGDTEAETDEDNARSDDGDGSRRRKRRRRRRGRRDSEGVEGEADGNGGDEASEGDAGDSEDSEETDDDGGDNRRRRRRRRGRGRYRSDSDAGDGSTDGEGQTAEADGDSQAQDNDSSEDSGEQDRRGRRRRRRKRTGDNPASHGGGQSEYGQPAVDPFSGSIPADPDAIAEAMESGALTPTADITSDPVAVPYPMDADSIVEAQSGETPATSPAQDEVAEVEPDLPLATDPEPIEEAAPESVPEAEVEALEEAVEEAVKEAPGLETEAAAEPAEEPEPAVAMAAEPADVEVQADDPKKPARTGWWQRIVS